MPDEAQFAAKERQLAAEIVAAYVRRNQIAADKIGTLISTVHQALATLGTPAEEERIPAVPVRRSVQRDRVICLDCGWSGKMLRRHIAGHGLGVDEYRRRWDLAPDHPLTAPAYAEQRSDLAKQLGLGRRGERDVPEQEPAAPAAEALPIDQPTARRRRRSRSMLPAE